MVEKEVKFGPRIILLNYKGRYNKEIVEFFIKAVKRAEGELVQVMNKYSLPMEVNLNFKRGHGALDGLYHIQKKDLAKNLVAIDIFTDGIKLGKNKKQMLDLEKNLIDTFIHEIVHHRYAKEGKTKEETKKIADKIISQFFLK